MLEEVFFKEMVQATHIYEENTRYQRFVSAILRVLDKRWFKMSAACFALLSLPLLITIAAVVGSSIPLTVLIIVQILMFVILFPRTFATALRLYILLTPYHYFWGMFTVVFSALCTTAVYSIPESASPLPEILRWSFLQYLSFGSDEDDESSNSNLLNFGFNASMVVTILFYLMMLLVLPVAAYFEEVIFRRGTKSWLDATPKSIVFGLIHMTMGVPFGLCLFILSLLGFWFTREYFLGVQRYLMKHRLEDDIIDDVQANFGALEFKPHAGVGCTSGIDSVIPGATPWKIQLYKDDIRIFYWNKETNVAVWEKPHLLQAKHVGTRDAALLHLGHNFVAINVTFIGIILAAATGTSLSF